MTPAMIGSKGYLLISFAESAYYVFCSEHAAVIYDLFYFLIPSSENINTGKIYNYVVFNKFILPSAAH